MYCKFSVTDHNTKFSIQFNHISHSFPVLKWLEDPARTLQLFTFINSCQTLLASGISMLNGLQPIDILFPVKRVLMRIKLLAAPQPLRRWLLFQKKRPFLEAKPLVRTVDNKKSLELSSQLIDIPNKFFSEFPPFL